MYFLLLLFFFYIIFTTCRPLMDRHIIKSFYCRWGFFFLLQKHIEVNKIRRNTRYENSHKILLSLWLKRIFKITLPLYNLYLNEKKNYSTSVWRVKRENIQVLKGFCCQIACVSLCDLTFNKIPFKFIGNQHKTKEK